MRRRFATDFDQLPPNQLMGLGGWKTMHSVRALAEAHHERLGRRRRRGSDAPRVRERAGLDRPIGHTAQVVRNTNCHAKSFGPNGRIVRYGWGGIRTRETLSGPHAFQACALNRSATHPRLGAQAPRETAGRSNGQGEIRTHDTGVTGMPVFETGAFSHSATCPTTCAHTRQRRAGREV